MSSSEPGIYVQLLNARGRVVAAPPNLAGGELPVPDSSRQAIQQNERIFDRAPVAAGDANVRLLTVPLHQTGTDEVVGAVQVGESLAPFENTMAAVERLLLTTGIGALLLAVVVGYLLTRQRPQPGRAHHRHRAPHRRDRRLPPAAGGHAAAAWPR